MLEFQDYLNLKRKKDKKCKPPPPQIFKNFLNLAFIAFFVAFFTHTAKAIELSDFIKQCDGFGTLACYLKGTNLTITNTQNTSLTREFVGTIISFTNSSTISGSISINGAKGIAGSESSTNIANLYNYGIIKANSRSTAALSTSSTTNGLQNIVNSGTIDGIIQFGNAETGTSIITNLGTITGGIYSISSNNILIIDNSGTLDLSYNQSTVAHIRGFRTIQIKNHTMKINQSQSEFNAFSGYTNGDSDTSHLVISGNANVSFVDANSRLILILGNKFELNKAYSLDKLITDEKGAKKSISNITTNAYLYKYLNINSTSSILNLSYSDENGGSFIINTDSKTITQKSIIVANTKQNLQSINTLLQNSDTLLFARNLAIKKSTKSTARKSIKKGTLPSEIYDTHYAKAPKKVSSPLYDHIYFAPFVSFDSNSEGLEMSGMSYGVVGVYSRDLDAVRMLGFQLGVSVEEFDDKNADTLNLKDTSLMLGAHYKHDLRDDIFIAARVDGFYMMNTLNDYTNTDKFNNYAFAMGASVNKSFGDVGVKGGLDGRVFKQSEIKLSNDIESYDAAMLKMLFIDIGANYAKSLPYKLNFDLNLGGKYNVLGENTLNMTLLNATYEYGIDTKYYIYGGLGLQYALTNSANLGLRYNANLGSQTTHHSGFAEFEWRW